MTIKYRYAIDNINLLWKIDDIVKNECINKHFYCVSCGECMIPKIGKEIRQKHFAHKVDKWCSNETYLHKLSKLIFENEYKKCLNQNISFFIKLCQKYKCNLCETCKLYEQSGCEKEKFQKFDIIKYLKEIQLEVNDGTFRPDILLIGNNKKIFIEFKVNHESSEEKIKSNNCIIEIEVANEDDLKFINEHIIVESNKIKFYNFKPIVSKECINDEENLYFIFYDVNQIKFEVMSVKKYKQFCENHEIIFNLTNQNIEKQRRTVLFYESLGKLYRTLGVKTCGACRYYSYHIRNCNFKKYCMKKQIFLPQYWIRNDCEFFDGLWAGA